MRAKEFITEAQMTPQEAAAAIIRDCQPYIQAVGGPAEAFDANIPAALYRGTERSQPVLSKLAVRSNRQPTSSDVEHHTVVDNWMLKNFGHRYRSNALFATGDFSQAEQYGNTYLIFPIGEFKFCWSPKIQDLTYDLLDQFGVSESELKKLARALPKAEYETDSLQDAVSSLNEVMISCGEYYMLRSPEESPRAASIMRAMAKMSSQAAPRQPRNRFAGTDDDFGGVPIDQLPPSLKKAAQEKAQSQSGVEWQTPPTAEPAPKQWPKMPFRDLDYVFSGPEEYKEYVRQRAELAKQRS